jgi:ankyrin repeat protein
MCYVYEIGWTPLMSSVDEGNMEMFKLLINNGALPSINISLTVNI